MLVQADVCGLGLSPVMPHCVIVFIHIEPIYVIVSK